MASKEIVTSERIVAERKEFLWHVTHFEGVRKSEDLIKAQAFTFKMGKNIGLPTKWECLLDPREKNGGKYIGIFVKLTDFPENIANVYTSVHFKIEDPTTKSSYYLNNKYTKNMIEDGSGDRWGYPLAIEQQGDRKVVPLTSDGSLAIYVAVTIFNLANPVPPILESVVKTYDGRFMKKFHSDLAALRTTPLQIMDQVTRFVSKDGKEISVNRVILSARSPVFRSMFQAGMDEAETGIVKVDDINADPLELLLDFCHSGVLKAAWKNVGVVDGLLYGAHKYMLDDLLEFLDNVVHLICTPENCGKLLSLAKTFEMKEAEKHLFEYFKEHMVTSLEQVLSFAEDIKKWPDYTSSNNE